MCFDLLAVIFRLFTFYKMVVRFSAKLYLCFGDWGIAIDENS